MPPVDRPGSSGFGSSTMVVVAAVGVVGLACTTWVTSQDSLRVSPKKQNKKKHGYKRYKQEAFADGVAHGVAYTAWHLNLYTRSTAPKHIELLKG